MDTIRTNSDTNWKLDMKPIDELINAEALMMLPSDWKMT